MRNRYYRIFTFALMLVMLLMSMNLTAFASSYGFISSNTSSFTFLNMSGCPVSELYFYPSSNNTCGQTRNSDWIYNGNSTTVRLTNAELRLNTDWTFRVCFTKGGSHYFCNWTNITLSDFINAGTVVLSSNEYGGMTLDFGGVDSSSQSSTFTLLNMTGNPITEIYFYPINNSTWGKLRNTNWVSNGNEVKIRLTANELAVNTTWCMRLGFSGGRYAFVYWEDVPVDAFVDSGYVTIYIDNGVYMYDIY